jgi:hypothetical protein
VFGLSSAPAIRRLRVSAVDPPHIVSPGGERQSRNAAAAGLVAAFPVRHCRFPVRTLLLKKIVRCTMVPCCNAQLSYPYIDHASGRNRTGRTMAYRKNGENDMTSKTATNDVTDFFGKFAQGLEDIQARFGFQSSGRDTALKGIATTREHIGTARQAFSETAGKAETMAGEAGAVCARAARDMAEAGFANADMALDAFEKMLTAANPAEAFKAQTEYLRAAATSNAERMRKGAENAQETLSANARQVRAGLEKLNPLGRMAA